MVPVGVLLGAAGFVFERMALDRGAWSALIVKAAKPRAARERMLTFGLAVIGLAAVLAWAAGRYVRFVLGLQDHELAADLAVFCAALACAALPWAAAASAGVLRRVLRMASVLPASVRRRAAGVLEALSYGAIAALLILLLREHAGVLGPLFALPYACLLGLAFVVVVRYRLVSFAHGRHVWRLWIAASVGFALAAIGLSALHGANAAVRRTLGPARAKAFFERLADVDHDGQAGLFGGRDCAPLDATRGPLAFDVPGNGVDENCSGRDAELRATVAAARVQAEPLAAELVHPRNVVLIVVDALRADRLGLGRDDSLTPVLDRLAARSVVFTEAFSQSPSTRISFPSFLSGKEPASLGWVRDNGWLQSDATEPVLAELLKAHGYTTGLVINHWIRVRLTRLQRGYDVVLDNRESQGEAIAPALAGPSSTARAIEFIERAVQEEKPFFLTLYHEGPHAPYADLSEHGFAPRGPRPIDHYDAEVRYVDQQIGHLLDHLSVKAQTLGNTIVIVTADHGEEFGEHGGKHHDAECYRESTHVPLIVHAPGFAPGRVRARVGLTNIVPTVLSLVGAPLPPGLDGRNAIAVDPGRYAHVPDEPVSCAYFANKNPRTSQVLAVRDEGFLYLERSGGGAAELYDTTADRRERENLALDPGHGAAMARLRPKIRALQMAR